MVTGSGMATVDGKLDYGARIVADLHWFRLAGILRRQEDLLRKLVGALLRQRESLALFDLSGFQTSVLEQIEILEELDRVKQAFEDGVQELQQACGAVGNRPFSELMERAPESLRQEIERARGDIQTLAEEAARLGKRNARLVETLGELQAEQYRTVLEALTAPTKSYSVRKEDGLPVSLCDVVG